MNVLIFADLIECVTDGLVLHYQHYDKAGSYNFDKHGTAYEYRKPSCGIYILSSIGSFELHLNYELTALMEVPSMVFNYCLEHSFTGVCTKTLEEMVEMQLESEAYLSGVASENIKINNKVNGLKEK